MVKPLDEPFRVVARDELADDPARLGETLEAIEIEALLLERPHETLDDAIALRLADVRRRDRHPQPLHLVDPRIGDVLRPPPGRSSRRRSAGRRDRGLYRRLSLQSPVLQNKTPT